MAIIRESALVGDKEITIEVGRIARQAGGSALVQCGETMVLVTVCEGPARPGMGFFPLTVEYQEKTYAAGRIPGGYNRREGRLSDHEILASRLVDRPIRPLFPDEYANDTQVIATVISTDQENPSDVLAITGASAALMVSHIPWDGPIAGVRVGRIKGQFVANPTFAQREESDLDVVMAGSAEALVMVEGEAQEVDEETMLQALDFGHKAIKDLLNLQVKIREAVGKAKMALKPAVLDAELLAEAKKFAPKFRAAMTTPGKEGRRTATQEVSRELKAALAAKFEGNDAVLAQIGEANEKVQKTVMRSMIVDEGKRLDGRGLTEVRPITIELGVLPRAHGSAIFTRGETQALVALTLGTGRDAQKVELLTGQTTRDFMLHYNFPPFSVGEVKPLRGPGRREMGHGALACRAVEMVSPKDKLKWPYTMRLVSEILESNGSSSMATVCGSTLAMFDGGVPMKAPVAGIAMGLIAEDGKYAVLSDILGDEDHLGDMDFKVCGTKNGITAFQLDTKIAGIPRATMKQALSQARDGRLHILGKMLAAIAEPRTDLSEHAPRITTLKIKPSQIGAVIGTGGKTIRGITEQTGASIEIEDDGTVTIASTNRAASDKAMAMIQGLTQEAEVGKTYTGIVKRIMDFGAFVEIMPGTEGLCHISELSDGRVAKVEDVVKEGEEILVKCVAVDRSGKIRLSRKEALADQRN